MFIEHIPSFICIIYNTVSQHLEIINLTLQIGNICSERLSNLPKVTQLMRNWAYPGTELGTAELGGGECGGS